MSGIETKPQRKPTGSLFNRAIRSEKTRTDILELQGNPKHPGDQEIRPRKTSSARNHIMSILDFMGSGVLYCSSPINSFTTAQKWQRPRKQMGVCGTLNVIGTHNPIIL